MNNFFQGFTLDKLQETKTAGPILDLLDDQNVHKGNKYYVAGKENDELLDSVSVRADVDIVDEDKAIQVPFLSPVRKRFRVFIFYFFAP